MSVDQPDPWGVLNARYGHDETAQFMLFIEQLVEVRALLLDESLTKQRLALVAIDNLAEVVLVRHLRIIDRLAERNRRALVPRLTTAQRRRFRSDFNYRVRIAVQGAGDELHSSILGPIVDELDAAVFRVGHAYRNRIYHADHHNEIALPLISRVYAAAVGRAFIRQQPTQSGTQIWPALREQLDVLGYDEQAQAAGPFGAGYLTMGHAAETIVARQLDDLQPPLSEIRDVLSDDLLWRIGWARAMVRRLIDDGFELERIIWAADWGEKWDAISGDEEVVRLDTEIAQLEAHVTRATDINAHFQAISDLQEDRNRRIQELLRENKVEFDFGEVDRTEKAAGRLLKARTAASVFERYQQLDESMERVERRFDEVAIGFDQFVQDETDRLRGK